MFFCFFFAIVWEIIFLPSYSQLATPKAPFAGKEKVPLCSRVTAQYLEIIASKGRQNLQDRVILACEYLILESLKVP